MLSFKAQCNVLSLIRVVSLSLVLSACAYHTQTSLYDQMGGQAEIEKLSDAFIEEIQFDKQVFHYFAESNIDRFREKFIEHVCVTLDGPCEYTGDEMLAVHRGMNINEADFNRVVELLVNAMSRIGISYPLQNQILARFAPMRADIIYH